MPVCGVEDCGKPTHARGYCNAHYLYLLRRGKEWSRDEVGKKPPERRFQRFVDRRGDDECWPFKGHVSRRTGYGSFGWHEDGLRNIGAHRAAFAIAHGYMPDGKKVVMHTCDNRACVNPAHLKLGTHSENTRDMIDKGRHRFQAPLGQASSLSKITERQARFIKAHPEISADEIAEVFGIKAVAVWRIRSGRTWPHLTA